MHKQKLIKENKLKICKLEIFLLTDMGIFSNLKRKNVKDSSRTFFKKIPFQKEKLKKPTENLVNLHLETVEKVDHLITKNHPEIDNRNPNTTINSKIEASLSNNIELRDPIVRTKEISNFNSEITPNDSLSELNKVEEFYEIQPQINDSFENQKVNDDDFKNNIEVDKDKESQKLFWSFIKIKGKSKDNTKNNNKNFTNNNYNKTKDELERTKEEIEAKKRELEMIEQREKERELEQKKKEEEKREQDKLELIEIQKQQKEVKLREIEAKKIEIRREKERKLEQKKIEQEKRRLEKLRQIELKKKMKEDKLKEKELNKIEMEREKERQIEQKKMEEEKRKQEMLIEKIESEKEKERQIEIKKMEEEKLRQKIEAEKEMEKQLEIKKIEEQNKEKEEIQSLKNKDEENEHILKDKFQKVTEEPPIGWDEDVEKLIPIIDSLLEKLPDEVIDEFAKSENFTLYEKVILKYKK